MTLRLLCDENIDVGLADALEPEFETARVPDVDGLGAAAADDEIWMYADENGYTIPTGDEDFVTGAA